jgi:undecaprenyl diphosphate synthase
LTLVATSRVEDGAVVSDWKSALRRSDRRPVPLDPDVDVTSLPRHVAIIMDGNGRWARARGLPRAAGHHAGMGAMRETIRAADDLGIGVLTLYAFSTENWKRPEREVRYLWHLVGEFFRSDMDELVERNVRVVFIGDTEELPYVVRRFVRSAKERTHQNTGMVVQFALNYGSRTELVRAVRCLAERVAAGELSPADIDDACIAGQLETSGLPDPDLLIRTAGDQRISNFLLWQIAYTELYFVDDMWPDFRPEHLREALEVFGKRERRFGGIK